jgi:iron-sulfur cluster repair protein YtfE (RIC family)
MRNAGPTAVMRFEHEQIRRCLSDLDAALSAGQVPSEGDDDRLLAILSAHNVKEETILYPMIDRQVTSDERHRVFRSMAGT